MFFCSAFIGKAQDCSLTVSGKISDLHDSSPIFGVLIVVNESRIFAQTDESGNYVLRNLCKGKINLTVTHPSCDTLIKKVTLRTSIKLNFQLKRHITELEEIIAEGQSSKIINKTVQETLLTADVIDRLSSQSLGEALATISGVSALKTGNSIAKPIIHGMYGSRVSIVNRNFLIQDQEWGADHAPTVDTNAFENIQLLKGAAALKYSGSATGRIIVLSSPRVLLCDSIYGKAILNGTSNGRGVVAIANLTKSYQNGYYFAIQGTLKKYGDFKAPDYQLGNTGLEERNMSFNWGRNQIAKGWETGYSYFRNSNGILKASHIGTREDLFRAIKSGISLQTKPFSYAINAPKQESSHHNVYLKWFSI